MEPLTRKGNGKAPPSICQYASPYLSPSKSVLCKPGNARDSPHKTKRPFKVSY